jgi:polysaccharide deacetylase family protein (PEP-CTERM system associated)
MNLLTFDIEDWYHINYPTTDFQAFDRQEDHGALLDRLRSLLGLCRAHQARATFFVLGRLLEKCPRIGELILEAGQELALHGYDHHLLRDRGPEGLRRDLEHSLRIYRDLAGAPPLGFRAPSWSIGPDTLWALKVIASFGFLYDASIFPVRNFLYGIPAAPLRPFYPRLQGRSLKLLEIPVSVWSWGKRRVPYSGGLYFNLWPWAAIRFFARRVLDQGRYNLFYFHPWDLWPRPKRLIRQLKARWLQLHIGDPRKKFETLLARYRPQSLADVLPALKQQAEPADPLGEYGLQ